MRRLVRLIRIYTVCHYVFDFRLKSLLTRVDLSKFEDGGVHFRNSGLKGFKRLVTLMLIILWILKLLFNICDSGPHTKLIRLQPIHNLGSRAHTYISTYVRASVRAFVSTYIHTYIHTYIKAAYISLSIPAVLSGISLSANKIIGNYRIYEWRAKVQMIRII